MVVACGTKISKLVAVEGGQIELFWGACTTTQRGDGRLRFPLGPLTPAGKREEKTKENEGKSLKTGGKWRKMEEWQEKNDRTWRKIVQSRGKTEENGGTPKLNGEQRLLGSEQDSLQGDEKWYWGRGAKGCKARRSLPKVLQMVWASSRRLTSRLRIITVGGGQCKV